MCLCVYSRGSSQAQQQSQAQSKRLNELHDQQGPLVRQSSAGKGKAQPDDPNLYTPPGTALQAR